MKKLFSDSLKTIYIFVGLIFSFGNLYSQPAPELSDLNICFDGEKVSIASFCDVCHTKECNGFLVYKNDEYYDWVNEYNFINFSEDNGKMVELIKYNEEYENINANYYERAIINIKTGEYIIPFGEQSIEYIYEDRLFIVNNNGNGTLIDTYGKTISRNKYIGLAYIEQLGYYDQLDYNIEEKIFDKNENTIFTFPKFSIIDVIDTLNFIAKPIEESEDIYEGFYIIDKEETILFYDECGQITIQQDSLGNSNVIGFGLCDAGDSYSLLIQNKKGMWYNPMTKFLETHYVDYISSIYRHGVESERPVLHKKKEVLCYVIAFDDNQEYNRKGYFLDTKGKIILEVEGIPRFNAVQFNQHYNKKAYPFIYFFTQYSSESFSVYDEDGSIILGHPDNYKNFIDESINQAGYYSFYNETLNETYLFYSKTKQLVTLKGIVTFQSLTEVEKYF